MALLLSSGLPHVYANQASQSLGLQSLVEVDPFLLDSLSNDLGVFGEDAFKGSEFQITSTKIYKNWVILDITSMDSPYNIDEESLGVGDARTVAIAVKRSGSWDIMFEFEEGYLNRLRKTPEELISGQAKRLIERNIGDLSVGSNLVPEEGEEEIPEEEIVVDYRFPWDSTEEWVWQDRGGWPVWHGSNCGDEVNEYCAIDIGVSSNDKKRLIAAADGVIVGLCRSDIYQSVNVVVEHEDGKRIHYYHIDKEGHPENDIQLFGEVEQGQLLGYLWEGNLSSDCGGSYAIQLNGFGHVHLVIPKNDMVIDGWEINYPEELFRKEGETIEPGDLITSTNEITDGCIPYQNPWVVDQDCIYSSQVYAPGNIHIVDGAELVVLEEAVLKADLRNSYIMIDEDARLLIEPGGSLISL